MADTSGQPDGDSSDGVGLGVDRAAGAVTNTCDLRLLPSTGSSGIQTAVVVATTLLAAGALLVTNGLRRRRHGAI